MMNPTWLGIFKNLATHPRTETVPLPSGCSLVPEKYTPLQRSFLDLVKAQPDTFAKPHDAFGTLF